MDDVVVELLRDVAERSLYARGEVSQVVRDALMDWLLDQDDPYKGYEAAAERVAEEWPVYLAGLRAAAGGDPHGEAPSGTDRGANDGEEDTDRRGDV